MTQQSTPESRTGLAFRIVRAATCVVLAASLAAPANLHPLGEIANGMTPAEHKAQQDLRQLANLTVDDNAVILGHGKTAEELNAEIPMASTPKEQMAAFRTIRSTDDDYASALQCLSQAIYYEAVNEPLAGQRAVAQVVLNRVRHPAYPASVCGVVYEGWNQPVCQFSFVCDGSLQRRPLPDRWRQVQAVARQALAGYVEGSVGSATHYHADYVLPRWAYTLAKVNRIGHHLFYRFPGRGGRMASFNAAWSGTERIPRIDFARFEDLPLVDEAAVSGVELLPAHLMPDASDRRADNDIGGRMDPSKQWRLDIPDPVNASVGYNASRQSQAGDGGHAFGGVTQ